MHAELVELPIFNVLIPTRAHGNLNVEVKERTWESAGFLMKKCVGVLKDS
jgi:hypothetical protein